MNIVEFGSIMKLFEVLFLRNKGMARPSKNGTYLNVYIETSIYEELSELCNEVSQSKTIAVERAFTTYWENHEKTQ